MGLDMHLYAERGLYAYIDNEDHAKAREFLETELMGKSLSTNSNRLSDGSITVRFEVAYWRKANAIHAWFVENVQGGRDECQTSYVSDEQLRDLIGECSRVLSLLNPFCEEAYDTNDSDRNAPIPDEIKDEVEKILTPTRGFFFGSIDIDQYFYHDVRYTHDRLSEILEWVKSEQAENRFWEIYYRASW